MVELVELVELNGRQEQVQRATAFHIKAYRVCLDFCLAAVCPYRSMLSKERLWNRV